MPAPQEPRKETWTPPKRSRTFVLVVFGIVLYLGTILACLVVGFPWGDRPLIHEHFPATVGLPMEAALAFLVVLLLPQAYGEVEFKAFDLSFKGAAGPVVPWLLCFPGIAVAVKALW